MKTNIKMTGNKYMDITKLMTTDMNQADARKVLEFLNKCTVKEEDK